MPLKIDAKPLFWTDVKVTLPGEEPQIFRARFIVVDYSAGDDDAKETVEDFLFRVIVDVDDVIDGDEPAVLTEELLERLITRPDIRVALFRAYHEGLAAAARGN